jgi:uncharacterized circularly permuted ATP-grasp superfamily protein/uncharacterized alpha-E superfamily protein
MHDETPLYPWNPHAPPSQESWDDFFDHEGHPRQAAQHLVNFLGALDSAGLRQRAEQVRQLVRDHGVNYNVPGEGQAGEHPWQLDPIPAVMDTGEFCTLAKGLAERAHLLDRVLHDFYGAQTLVRQGFIPARLVLGNPAFLRPCHGLDVVSRLHLYAADIARTAKGSFCVLRDRTQAPTGVGYALENRLVISQVFEEPFRKSNILRLASFFRTLRETLASLSPRTRDNPRIVMQSSGPSSPTYFEQAFLAQYLGYPLVEGGDLTVRDRRVFLKTLGGLSPVDVIFRHPDDDYCDPLELRADSHLGVPGLVEAVRAGQVAVANALGSGLAQSPAFLPFLPTIAHDFFGEDLSLVSAPAYWCGDATSLSHVLAHLDTMVIRPAWAGAGPSIVFGDELEGNMREAFVARLRATPDCFVAQEKIDVAQSPALSKSDITLRSAVVRSYALLSNGNFQVMPGGLMLANASPDAHSIDQNIAIARGACSKDLWVRSESPVEHFSLLPSATHLVELSRGGADLPSRSADNLFWLGRYTERAEAMARLARYVLGRLAEEGDESLASSPALLPLLEVLATSSESSPLSPGQGLPMAWLANALCSLAPAGSLRNTLRSALRSAAAVRDRLSADTFRVLGALGDETERAETLSQSPALGSLTAFLDRVVTNLSALSGLAMESMTRGHGWRFLDMGHRLERALQLLSLLRAAFAKGAQSESMLLEALLAVADSSITYRRRYLAGLHPAAVVDLLLVDDGNPRAVLFQVAALREHLNNLPHEGAQARLSPEERLALGVLTRLQLLDVVPACQATAEGQPPLLLSLLGSIESDLLLLSDGLCSSYLSHALMPRALASLVAKAAP